MRRGRQRTRRTAKDPDAQARRGDCGPFAQRQQRPGADQATSGTISGLETADVYDLTDITQTVEKAGEQDEEHYETEPDLPSDKPGIEEKSESPVITDVKKETAETVSADEEFSLSSLEKEMVISETSVEIKIPEKAEISSEETKEFGETEKPLIPEGENSDTGDSGEELPEIEIEIKGSFDGESVRGEALANEVYYKFETKFFEEVKILEKLFSQVGKEYLAGTLGQLGERTLQVLTQIIEISSELGNLSRQLSLDLTADIFLTINLYFTKAISSPNIITGDRLKLMDSSLSLVISLIKGEDYLDYNKIVDKIVQLKEDIQKPTEQKIQPRIVERTPVKQHPGKAEQETRTQHPVIEKKKEEPMLQQPGKQVPAVPLQKQTGYDVTLFKMKYLVKEFEKNFKHLSGLKNEYAKFEALDEVDVLNNSLRLLAKISASVKLYDVCKLAEVSYIFLKYLKDYRIDLLDPEGDPLAWDQSGGGELG